MATDVRLPLDHAPVFPAVCCGCLVERPTELLRVAARRVSWWESVFPWLWLTARRVHAEVPACAPCRHRWRRRWWLVRLAAFGCLAVSAAVLLWLGVGEGLPRSWRRLLLGAIAVASLLPVAIWAVCRPPLAALTVDRDHVDYEFASGAYAERFRRMNAMRSLRFDPQRTAPGG